MKMQPTVFGRIFTILGVGTTTLARHPHTRKYWQEGVLPFHGSYEVFSSFFQGTLFKMKLLEKITFSPPINIFFGNLEFNNVAFIISFNV